MPTAITHSTYVASVHPYQCQLSYILKAILEHLRSTQYYILIAIVERRYREISRVHCRVLLRVRSTSNNAKGNERVVFPRYRRSTMAIRYLSYI